MSGMCIIAQITLMHHLHHHLWASQQLSLLNPFAGDFLTQFLANLLATIIGGVVIYFLLEYRLRKIESERVVSSLIKNLYLEVIKDFVIAERIGNSAPTALSKDVFPIAKFKTDAISNFIASRPFPGEEEFYSKLSGVATNMESTNSLIDLVFMGPKSSIHANKASAISSASSIKGALDEVLRKIVSLNKGDKYFIQEAA